MNFLELASKMIPGYDLLSQEQQDDFQATEAGQFFASVVNQLVSEFNEKNANASLVSNIFFFVVNVIRSDYEQQKEKSRAEHIELKKKLINQIENTEEYKSLINTIILKFLSEKFPDFSALTPIQQTKLAEAPFSLPLQSEYLVREEQKKEAADFNEIAMLDAEQEEIYQQWFEHFKICEEMAFFRESITKHYAQTRAEKLAGLFPLLSNDEFIDLYLAENNKEKPDFPLMEEQFLTKIIAGYLQKTAAGYINFLNLDNFNQKAALSFANDLSRAADDNESFRINILIESYGYALRQNIRKARLLINNKMLEPKDDEDTALKNSLSYLFWHSEKGKDSKEFLDKLAEAHAFIQLTGMATQNESSYFALLDFYNYIRSADKIIEVKTIFYGLLQPFIPLYDEYKNLALYEKNIFRKFLRAIMPLLIVAGVIIVTGFLLSPLGIPEFAFLIVAIPALIIGICLASAYVTFKNQIYYHIYQNWLNDGPFNIPEFQVNPRMIGIFGENAGLIRAIYIEELKLCDELEQSFLAKEKIGLTEEELKLRQENTKKRHSISLEWYDIHSNTKLACDKVPKIAQKRLNQILNETILELEKSCEDKEDLGLINTLVDHLVTELTDLFANNIVRPAPDPNPNLFFKPKSLEHQKKAEEIDLALNKLGAH